MSPAKATKAKSGAAKGASQGKGAGAAATVDGAQPAAPQSAAMPSPFPPIAQYAFLSDCHTGALVAPDGAVDWLCVPRFDSASVFGMLLDAMRGDSTHFTRQDGVEECWRIFQPLLDDPPPVHPYAPGSWGPEEAEKMVAAYGGWHGPWVVS